MKRLRGYVPLRFAVRPDSNLNQLQLRSAFIQIIAFPKLSVHLANGLSQ